MASNVEAPSRWHERITTSKKFKEQVRDEHRWPEFIEEYHGNYKVKLGNILVPPVNDVYSYVKSSQSTLYFKDPFIAVNPKKNSTIESAVILEAAVNCHWRKLKIKQEIESEIMDSILVGHSWNKTGTNVKLSGKGDDTRLESQVMYSNRVSWEDVFFNLGSMRPTVDSLWMAHRIWRPVDFLKKEYGSAAKNIKGMPHPYLKEALRKDLLWKDDIDQSAIYEIWDAMDRKIYLLAEENPKQWLADPRPWPEYLVDFPFDMLSFNDSPYFPYPMSDIAPWEGQVKEKIKVMAMALNHIKRWNRQMLIKKSLMDPSDIDKYEKGIDGAILEVKGDLAQTKALDWGTLPPDIYLILDRLDRQIDSTSGKPGFERGGITQTKTRTYGELELIQQGANSRSDTKIDRIETHCENIARKLIAHMKENFDLEEMVDITGEEPKEILTAFEFQGRYDPVSRTIKFSKEDIKGEYDVEVKAGSTLPLNKQTRDAVLDRVYELSIPLASAPSIPPFVAEIAKERLRGFGLKGLERAFDQQLAENEKARAAQAEQAKIEGEKTQAEGTKRAAQSAQIMVDTAIKGAQAIGKTTGLIPNEVSINK